MFAVFVAGDARKSLDVGVPDGTEDRPCEHLPQELHLTVLGYMLFIALPPVHRKTSSITLSSKTCRLCAVDLLGGLRTETLSKGESTNFEYIYMYICR